MNEYMEDRKEQGFTLIELLIAIVVVGILTAVAIVGIAGLTDKGSTASCSATLDAVKAAQAVHYANNAGEYPQTFDEMITDKELELSGGADHATAGTVNTITGHGGWSISTDSAVNDGSAPLVVTSDNGATPAAACDAP
jgi:MSHA pilin protein MshA